jgi:2-polyprenyl-6-methoxyphenol hydroxylase-like FAD-dependent oxidoreductase
MGTAHRTRYDVAVVGARAGGAATAMLLGRMGHDVVVLDRAMLPSDTLSTHSIARSGVVQLQRWGLLGDVLASGAPAIRQVTFHTAEGSKTRQVKDTAGVDLLVAPRRYALDAIVAGAAADAGATLRLGTTVTGLRRDATGRVVGLVARDADGRALEVDAEVVVGADGLRSQVARSAAAAIVDTRPTNSSAYYAYYGGIAWPGIEFFVADRAFAGIFPTHAGEACIWVCAPADVPLAARRDAGDPARWFEGMLERVAPALAARLRPARRTSPVRGTVRLPNQVRQAWGPGWALVGDALYHRDPVTGHGISDAYRDADLLARALDGGLRGERPLAAALDAYRRQTDEARREIFAITCALAAYPPPDEFTALQRRISAAIEAEATALAARPAPVNRRPLAAA